MISIRQAFNELFSISTKGWFTGEYGENLVNDPEYLEMCWNEFVNEPQVGLRDPCFPTLFDINRYIQEHNIKEENIKIKTPGSDYEIDLTVIIPEIPHMIL